jgi:hypothetical protein
VAGTKPGANLRARSCRRLVHRTGRSRPG